MLKELNKIQYPHLDRILEAHNKRQDPQVMCSKCQSSKMATYYWAKRDGSKHNKYVCGDCGHVYRDHLKAN